MYFTVISLNTVYNVIVCSQILQNVVKLTLYDAKKCNLRPLNIHISPSIATLVTVLEIFGGKYVST